MSCHGCFFHSNRTEDWVGPNTCLVVVWETENSSLSWNWHPSLWVHNLATTVNELPTPWNSSMPTCILLVLLCPVYPTNKFLHQWQLVYDMCPLQIRTKIIKWCCSLHRLMTTALLRAVLTYCWVVFINKTENNTIIISKFTHTLKLISYKVFYDLQMSKHCHNIT